MTTLSPRRAITPDEARTAYAATGSMRAAGRKLGISGQRIHQILKASGGIAPPLTDSDRELLTAVVNLSRPVLRGPTSEQLADALGIKERALRYRIARLRRLNLLFADADHGFLPTAEARGRF